MGDEDQDDPEPVTDEELERLHRLHGASSAAARSALEKARQLRAELRAAERALLGEDELGPWGGWIVELTVNEADELERSYEETGRGPRGPYPVGPGPETLAEAVQRLAVREVHSLWRAHRRIADSDRWRRGFVLWLIDGGAYAIRFAGQSPEEAAAGQAEYAVRELGPRWAAPLTTEEGIALLSRAMVVAHDNRGGRGNRKWDRFVDVLRLFEPEPNPETVKRDWRLLRSGRLNV